jgi:hypothetical protein
MAKIQEEIIVIKFSRLVKDSDESNQCVTADTIASIAQVAEELVGNGVVVEVEQA